MFLPYGKCTWFSVGGKRSPTAEGTPEIRGKALLVPSLLVPGTPKLPLTQGLEGWANRGPLIQAGR